MITQYDMSRSGKLLCGEVLRLYFGKRYRQFVYGGLLDLQIGLNWYIGYELGNHV